jgi:hypothetical protein
LLNSIPPVRSTWPLKSDISVNHTPDKRAFLGLTGSREAGNGLSPAVVLPTRSSRTALKKDRAF